MRSSEACAAARHALMHRRIQALVWCVLLGESLTRDLLWRCVDALGVARRGAACLLWCCVDVLGVSERNWVEMKALSTNAADLCKHMRELGSCAVGEQCRSRVRSRRRRPVPQSLVYC